MSDDKSIYELLDELRIAHQELESYVSVSEGGRLNPEKYQDKMIDLRDAVHRKERALLVHLVPCHLGISERGLVSFGALGHLLQAIEKSLP